MNERNEPFKLGLWLSNAFHSLTENLDMTSNSDKGITYWGPLANTSSPQGQTKEKIEYLFKLN